MEMNPTELKRTRVVLHADHVSNVSSIDFPQNFDNADDDMAWDFEKFKKNFKVVISRLQKDAIEFDLIGIDASIANAFRRCLIAEIPTMAIESVFVLGNSSIVHDEILAQRLGLVPIKADPRLFQFKAVDDDATDLNTLVFKMKVKAASKNSKVKAEPGDILSDENTNVLSKHLIWEPQGDQLDRLADDPPRPVHDDIVLAKMRPGQEIDLEVHCQKGIGKEHAKWSPVATASYRLLPEIQILAPITGNDAVKFQKCFTDGVIEVFKNSKGEREARVLNARRDTVSREVLRHKEFDGKVRLTRVRDHFIFNIESTGILPPQILFGEAVQVLINKAKRVKEALTELTGDMQIDQ
ncbi:DNA-directed RNA polymerases I and III subunit RPAC1 [Physocladia obscura]|uniref:DNA-directed RNA polymerases I and III subunit RPAC1 n=1 Tax=Physocladia obscura TaxID=109957 RepID=A0AAD5XBS6_9FUNG|nr:DNA-directed RNA polymerases I and III subunit RPAC1 [Physocladia obscura]